MIDEGYIKFNLDWTEKPVGKYFEYFDPDTLFLFRSKLFEAGLIGYDEKEKVGYGNISRRCGVQAFMISGTQTGHLAQLTRENIAVVKMWDIAHNHLRAEGMAKPSSESLTHAAIYEADEKIRAVIHIHSSVFWNYYKGRLPATAPDIPYGTPQLAFTVQDLAKSLGPSDRKVFITLGHQDGVFAFGNSLEAAFNDLMALYSVIPWP